MKILFLCLVALFFTGLAKSEYSISVLTELPGVGLEIRNLNLQSDAFEIDEQGIEDFMMEKMEEYDIRLLSAIELDVMPGQPYLEVVVDIAHAQGPSHLYTVELELRELAQLQRPKSSVVVVALSTWERKTLGVANRPAAIYDAIDRLLRLFSDELKDMNS
ncbi:hypothetical protein MLD52_02125 [Puniceicoccaceae bacterium K14]|nr:hypothetical protein [Puniceicoccaceae bacterium K14]